MSKLRHLFTVACLLLVSFISAQVSENITLQSEVMLSLGQICDIEIKDNLVWLSGSEHMLMCFQLNPDSAPLLMGHYKLSDDVPSSPNYNNYGNMLVCENYLYFYEQMGGVQVFNISNPASIQLLGSITNCEIPNQPYVQEGTMIYALSSNSLKVWSFADPLNPITVGEHVQSFVGDVAKSGNYVYVSYYQSYSCRVAIINVSDAANPVLMGNYAIDGLTFEVYNGFLYNANFSTNSLSCYSLNNPVDPVYTGSVPFPNQIPNQIGELSLKADANMLYVRNDPFLLEGRSIPSNYFYFDLTIPSAPVAWPEIMTSQFQYKGEFAVGGAYFIPNISYYQADIYRNNGACLLRVDTIQRYGVYRSAMLGSYLMLNSGHALNTANLNNEPIFLQNSDFLCAKDNSVFTSSFYSIHKWSLDAENLPSLASYLQIWPTGEYHEYPTSYPLNSVGSYLYSNYIFFDIDLQNTIQDIDSPYAEPYKIVTSGNIAVAAYYTGLKFFEISNPLLPVQVCSLFNGLSTADISVSGNLLAIAKADIGLYLYDISIPSSPVMLCYKPNVLGINRLMIFGEYLITSGTHGLVVYSLSDPANLVQTGFYSDPGKNFYDVQVRNNIAYVCQGYQLSAFDLSAAVSNPDTPELPSEAIALANYPNPFSASTTITIQGKTDPHPFDLSIYNLKGQLVKCLYQGVATSNDASFEWDGRDIFQQSVASGVYFYRFAQGNTTITKRLLLIR